MLTNPNLDAVRQQALTALTAQFLLQGHSVEQAKHMAIAVIFQADLDLRNAQLANLLVWLRQDHPQIYDAAVAIVETTRAEFEHRVQNY